MKKIKFIFILIIFCICSTQYANAQLLGKWVLPTVYGADEYETYLLSFTETSIESSTLETLAWDIPCEFAAGGYNPNYDLLFYYLGDLFCYGDNSIEWNSLTNQGVIDFKPEFRVINKPGFNEKFFSFYTVIGSNKTSDNHFKYIETHFIDNEPQFSTEYDILPGMPQGVYMAFALTEEFNNERFLYASAQRSTLSSGNILKAGLKKWPVNINGVDTENMEMILEWDDPDYNFVEDDFSSYNLELKVDNNSNTVIAWISSKPISFEKVFMYFESNNQAQTIDLSQLQPGRIAGIEFSGLNDDIIYISCTNHGIIAYDYQNQEIAEYLTSNGEYGKTFLQTAPDGHIYAVSNNGQHLGRINMQTGNFEPGPEVFSFQLGETVSTYRTFNGENYFILPEHHVPHNYLTVELQTEDVCLGATDGSATITVTNGYINYTYTLYKYINNNWELLETVTIENNLYTFNNLSEGDYKYVVIDGHENTTEGFFSIVVGEDLFDVDEFEDIDSYDPAYWNEVNRTYQRGFRIFAGVDVTITNSNLYFGKYARIVIEPGATLTMNNSTLDYYAPCLEKWRGVEVAGVWNQPQIDEYGNYLQGRLSLENGSEISNAENAISLYTCNYPNEDERVILWGSAGGVVQANDALFRNNTKSVHFIPYQNTHPITGDPMLNLSYFKLDTFDINIDYIDHSTFYKHTDLYGVNGIDFEGCAFTNTATSGVSDYNMGIAAYGGGFEVVNGCTDIIEPCPPQSIARCTFNGFYRSIGAYYSLGYIYTFRVDSALFQNNSTGVYISGVDYAVIVDCNFEIGYNPGDLGKCGESNAYGIDIHEAMGFAVEDNEFTKSTGEPSGYYAGIRVFDCPSDHD
ncbi:MAG: SprB repeat-containing protein, partial [Mariniphaga sp.]|nr:SprB repeat-containing protein [Mariniphaga sp.]